MLDSHARPFFQKYLIDPVLPTLAQIGCSPTQITVLGLITGLCAAPMIIANYPWFAVLLLILSGYLDSLDGSLSRYLNKISPKGAFYDILFDRIVEITTVLGLYFYDPSRALSIILLLSSFLICLTTFLTTGILSKNSSNKSFHYSPGIIERFETFLFFILMILLPQYWNYLSYLFILLVLITSILRFKLFNKVLISEV